MLTVAPDGGALASATHSWLGPAKAGWTANSASIVVAAVVGTGVMAMGRPSAVGEPLVRLAVATRMAKASAASTATRLASPSG